jgi:hypothetical protein
MNAKTLCRVLTKHCCECGGEKILAKFYRHPAESDGYMPRCKACHNGCTTWNESQRSFFAERQLGDPSEESIRATCQRLQARWTDKQRQRRRRAATELRPVA